MVRKLELLRMIGKYLAEEINGDLSQITPPKKEWDETDAAWSWKLYAKRNFGVELTWEEGLYVARLTKMLFDEVLRESAL